MKGVVNDVFINGVKEKIRFPSFRMSSVRAPFAIRQEYGLDTNGRVSKDFLPFKNGSTEALIMEVIASGKISKLIEKGLILNERPLAGEISRNLALYDPVTGLSYTIGGLGFIDPDKEDHTHWVLRDPLLGHGYAEYQRKRGNNVGGTRYFTNGGYEDIGNSSVVGTMAYDSGPYHIVRKIFESEKLRDKGINTPEFIAAGPITSLEGGAHGFSVYRSFLTPDYLLNLQIFLDRNAQLRHHYAHYLISKYNQISRFHHKIGESHGQFTNTNTLVEISNITGAKVVCQIKDFETNNALPTSRDLIIEDWISESGVNLKVRKSPRVAAMIYDLQLAITQELNVLLIPIKHGFDEQKAFNYIVFHVPTILNTIADAYGATTNENAMIAIRFTVQEFSKAINLGESVQSFNRIIGGTFSHALFINSNEYRGEVQITS